MKANLPGIIVSTILLVAAIVYWQELFVFQKTTENYPMWAKSLPYPLMGAHILVFILLLPLLFNPSNNIAFIKSIFFTSAASPVIAYFFIAPIYDVTFSFNSMISYLTWAYGICCLPPSLLIIATSVIFSLFMNTRAN